MRMNGIYLGLFLNFPLMGFFGAFSLFQDDNVNNNQGQIVKDWLVESFSPLNR